MENTLTLNKPILIDDKEIKEINYSFDDLTARGFANAEKRKYQECNGITGFTPELDNTFHLYLAMEIIHASNPNIEVADLLMIKGTDLIKLTKIGQAFTVASDTSNATE